MNCKYYIDYICDWIKSCYDNILGIYDKEDDKDK